MLGGKDGKDFVGEIQIAIWRWTSGDREIMMGMIEGEDQTDDAAHWGVYIVGIRLLFVAHMHRPSSRPSLHSITRLIIIIIIIIEIHNSQLAFLWTMFGLRNRTAVVVGASGGIGSAVVDALGATGVFGKIIGTSRSGNGVPAGADVSLPLDVTDDESIADAASSIRAEADQVDLVLYAAGFLHASGNGTRGVLSPEKALSEVTRVSLETNMAVNAYGPLLVAQALETLLPRKEASVFASISARVGSIEDNRLGGWYAYRASKAAQNMALKCLAIELGRKRKHCTVMGLHPGTVATPLSAPFRSGDHPDVMAPDQSAHLLVDVMLNATPETHTGRVFAYDNSSIPA